MKIEYSLTERQKQEKGVFLTFRKVEYPTNCLDKLLGRKPKATFLKVFYPIGQYGLHMKSDMAYVPGGDMVMPHEYNIFTNLINMKDAENEPPAKIEKIYTREPFRCKEGWVNPDKEKEPTGE